MEWRCGRTYTGENASRSDSSDHSTHDQAYRIWSCATNETADFEQAQGDEEDPFDGVEIVKLAVRELKRARREQVA